MKKQLNLFTLLGSLFFSTLIFATEKKPYFKVTALGDIDQNIFLKVLTTGLDHKEDYISTTRECTRHDLEYSSLVILPYNESQETYKRIYPLVFARREGFIIFYKLSKGENSTDQKSKSIKDKITLANHHNKTPPTIILVQLLDSSESNDPSIGKIEGVDLALKCVPRSIDSVSECMHKIERVLLEKRAIKEPARTDDCIIL